ncbi:hypothetical protein [Xanthobacter pseudotagetidis]
MNDLMDRMDDKEKELHEQMEVARRIMARRRRALQMLAQAGGGSG